MQTTLFTDAPASTVPAASLTDTSPATHAQSLPPNPLSHEPASDSVRHMLFGTPDAVRKTIHNLHSRGYAEPNDWSPAVSTGRCNEVMRLLIKRVTA